MVTSAVGLRAAFPVCRHDASLNIQQALEAVRLALGGVPLPFVARLQPVPVVRRQSWIVAIAVKGHRFVGEQRWSVSRNCIPEAK